MSWTRLDRARRVVTVCVGLALFATGSNYCLLAALSGDAMACLAAPGTPAPARSHCGHDEGAAPESAPVHASPCCVTVAPVAKVTVEKSETATPLVLALDALPLDPAALVGVAPAPREGPPPAPDLQRAQHERAPPLS